MHKSWSVSYSYNNDGSKVSEVIHKSHNDVETLFKDEYSRINDKNLKEKIYKVKKDTKYRKILLGKSTNKQNCELLDEINGKQHHNKEKYIDLSSKFFNSPSTRHRLVHETPNNNLIQYNHQNELNNMFQQLNVSMFDDDDFSNFKV